MIWYLARKIYGTFTFSQGSRASIFGLMPAALCLLACAATVVLAGCDSGSTFLPPPPDGLRNAAAEGSYSTNVPVPPRLESDVAGARSIEMILDRRNPGQLEAILAAGRMQAGIDAVKFKAAVLGDRDQPDRQADLVREALARNPLALIVEPADPNDVSMAELIQKARRTGVPVVLLHRPLGAASTSPVASNGAQKTAKDSTTTAPASKVNASPALAETRTTPLVLVTAPSFAESARLLVASAIRNAKNSRLNPNGGTVILINPGGDPFIEERVAAIRDALGKYGITAVEEIKFSDTADAGAKLLTAKLKSNPKISMVLAADGLSTAACRTVMNELSPDRLFVLSAYAAEGNIADMTRVGDFAAVAGFIPMRVIRKAINIAVSLSRGHEVPSQIEVPIEVSDSPETSTTPQSPGYYRSKAASNKG